MEESEDVKEVLKFEDNETAKSLLGENDKHLRYIEYALHLTAHARGNEVTLVGSPTVTALGRKLLEQLYDLARRGLAVTIQDVEAAVNFMKDDPSADLRQIFMGSAVVSTGRRRIVPKSPAQKHYIETIENHDIVFGIGPAGTGKTYLAMAMAVAALSRHEVSRVVLARPAVEAGEKLGFLPGDLAEKVNPYLRPLYDALHDMMEFDRAAKLVERGVIEVAPLAFMRGRAQPVTSRVLTPFGWRQIGHLEVGDHVIGSDGRPTRVLGIYPQGVKEVYQIVATDGASTLCCAEHLWAVFTPEDRRRGKPARVVNVRDIIGRLRRAHQHRFEIPLLGAPVDFPAREVPLHPYVLGLLLGDGCLTGKTTPTFATTDAELVRSLESYLPGIRVTHKAGVDYVLRHPKGGRGGLRIPNPVTLALRSLGLCGVRSSTKFIPEQYLLNSPDVRLAVLQGLLDTDGGPTQQDARSCRVQYSTTSARLCEDVVFLVRSLGGVARQRSRAAIGRPPGRARGRAVIHRTDAYIVDIRLPKGIAPFRLKRKARRYVASGGGRPMRFVTSVETKGFEETACIRVAATDSLYVTDDFLLTHNTLNDSFVILDEAQNTTSEQMKMFLTRLGYNSKAVITGDVTQTDLPEGKRSGLIEARQILSDVEGIKFVYFTELDVVRHRLVQEIIRAYDRASGNPS